MDFEGHILGNSTWNIRVAHTVSAVKNFMELSFLQIKIFWKVFLHADTGNIIQYQERSFGKKT